MKKVFLFILCFIFLMVQVQEAGAPVVRRLKGRVKDGTYGATWNGDRTFSSSRNALYDYLIQLDTDADGDVDNIGTLTSATITGTTTPLVDLNPSGVGTQSVIDITPSAAMTTPTSEWNGIRIDASALDPSAAATDSEIYGVNSDMSGVLRTYIEDVEAAHLVGTLPTAVAGQMEPGIAAHLDGKFRVDYDATQSAAAETLTTIDVIIDTTGVTAGRIHAMDVAPSGGGSPTGLVAVGTHTGVAPIHQHTGAFASPGANYACEQTGGGLNFDDNLDGETIFVADSDTIMVGSASTFDEIEIILGTPATKDAFLRFYYNTAIDTWVRFFPGDDTEGMIQSGSIRFDNPAGWTNDGDPDAGGGAADAGYWIKIERNRVATPGTIIITTAKILSATEYYWDKDGNVLVKNVAGVTYGSDGSVTDAELLYINSLTGNVQDALDRDFAVTNKAAANETPINITEAEILAAKHLTNQGASSEGDLVLPALSYYVGIIFIVNEALIIEINPPSGELFDLDGTDLDANDCVDSPAVVGSKIALTRMLIADGSTWRWSLDTIRGAWIDTGASD